MSDPERLGEQSGLGADLLNAAKDDRPPALARKKALLLLGVDSTVAATSVSEAATTLGANASVGTTATSTALATKSVVLGTTTWAALAKWAGLGAAVALAASGVITMVDPRVPQALVPASRATAATARPTAVAPSSERSTSEITSPTEEPATNRPPTLASPREPRATSKLEVPRERAFVASEASAELPVSPPAPSVVPRAASTLAQEVAILDRVRDALAANRPDEALAINDQYAGQFPAGLLIAEAQVLRIEALVRKGDRANATYLANAFLHAHPTSALAPRVRSLLASPSRSIP